jgi:hypothetical protein
MPKGVVMNLKHHFQTAGLARFPVSLVVFVAVGLLSIAPAAVAADNGWGNASNGYGRYHESNSSAQAGHGWYTTDAEGQYHESKGSTGIGSSTAGSQAPTQ